MTSRLDNADTNLGVRERLSGIGEFLHGVSFVIRTMRLQDLMGEQAAKEVAQQAKSRKPIKHFSPTEEYGHCG